MTRSIFPALLIIPVIIWATRATATASDDGMYYGASVTFGAPGDVAMVFGNVRVAHGADTVDVGLDPQFLDVHPGAPEGNDDDPAAYPGAPEGNDENAASLHPGAPESADDNALRLMRSDVFPLAAGTTVFATVACLTAPSTMIALRGSTVRIFYDLSLVDARTGAVLQTMMHVALGGDADPLPPMTAVRLHYSGESVVAAYLQMRVTVATSASEPIAIEALVVHVGAAMAKQATPHAPLQYPAPECAPNPAHDYTTLRTALSHAGTVHVVVFDMLGRMVWSHTADALAGTFETRIATNDLHTGNYRAVVALDGLTIAEGVFAVVH